MNNIPADDEQALRYFENSDWNLCIPGCPGLHLPVTLVASFRDIVLRGYARWAFGSIRHLPPRLKDEGKTILMKDQSFYKLVEKYRTLGEWMHQEFTGTQKAEYGHYVSFAEHYQIFFQKKIRSFLEMEIPDPQVDELFPDDQFNNLINRMTDALLHRIGKATNINALTLWGETGMNEATSIEQKDQARDYNEAAKMLISYWYIFTFFNELLFGRLEEEIWEVSKFKERFINSTELLPAYIVDAITEQFPMEMDAYTEARVRQLQINLRESKSEELSNYLFLWPDFFDKAELEYFLRFRGTMRFLWGKAFFPRTDGFESAIASLEAQCFKSTTITVFSVQPTEEQEKKSDIDLQMLFLSMMDKRQLGEVLFTLGGPTEGEEDIILRQQDGFEIVHITVKRNEQGRIVYNRTPHHNNPAVSTSDNIYLYSSILHWLVLEPDYGAVSVTLQDNASGEIKSFVVYRQIRQIRIMPTPPGMPVMYYDEQDGLLNWTTT